MEKHDSEMSYSEISEVRTINPEIAAHNIASAYIRLAYNETNFPTGESVDFDTVNKIATTYEYAYNYAFNSIAHQNTIIDAAE